MEESWGSRHDVRADLKRFADSSAGELRIGAISAVLTGRFPGVLKSFEDENPGIDITLTEISSADGVRQLREDLLDLIFIADNTDTRGFDVRPFANDPVWVVGTNDHPLFRDRKPDKPMRFVDTLDHEHLSFHEGGALDDLIATATHKAKRQPDRRISIVRFDSLRRCVSAGLGLGFMRESSAKPYLDLENMKGVPLSDDWADSSLISVFPKSPRCITCRRQVSETAGG